MKRFRELARRGRLLRFRELAKTALASYGMEDARLRFIQYNENAIYRVDKPGPATRDNSAYLPNRYVLRIHAMSDSQAIASELTWLATLNGEAGLPVPAPVSTLSGRLHATIVTPGLPQGRVISLLCWLDGKKIQKGLRPEHLTALGQVVALCAWAWDKDWARMRDAFRAGYCQFRTLPEEQWEMLDLFIATQFATMVLWASEFLKHDPLRVAEYEPWGIRTGTNCSDTFSNDASQVTYAFEP